MADGRRRSSVAVAHEGGGDEVVGRDPMRGFLFVQVGVRQGRKEWARLVLRKDHVTVVSRRLGTLAFSKADAPRLR